jgi:hypothetical protein
MRYELIRHFSVFKLQFIGKGVKLGIVQSTSVVQVACNVQFNSILKQFLFLM